jgi:hypothetical protein
MVYSEGFHNLIVLSAEAETIVFPSSSRLMALTDCVCASILPKKSILSSFMLPTFICPSFDPA